MEKKLILIMAFFIVMPFAYADNTVLYFSIHRFNSSIFDMGNNISFMRYHNYEIEFKGLESHSFDPISIDFEVNRSDFEVISLIGKDALGDVIFEEWRDPFYEEYSLILGADTTFDTTVDSSVQTLEVYHKGVLQLNILIPNMACNNNNICENCLGGGDCINFEDILSCPSDCSVSDQDNYCEILEDGICDPDCDSGDDPDCNTYPIYNNYKNNMSTDFLSYNKTRLDYLRNVVLTIPSKGKIDFDSSRLNVQGKNLDNEILIDDFFIAVNDANLDDFNDSAYITFYNVDCSSFGIYYSPEFLIDRNELLSKGKLIGNEAGCFDSQCSELSCSNQTLTYKMESMSSTGIGDTGVPSSQSSSPSSSSSSSSGGGGGGGRRSNPAVCISDWTCFIWTKCASGKQTRTCADKNICLRPTGVKPDEQRECVISENWECSEWEPKVCPVSTIQSRVCVDKNNAGTENAKPEESQTCKYEPNCFDSVQNQDEEDVDCGGSCEKCANLENAIKVEKGSNLWWILLTLFLISSLSVAVFVSYIHHKALQLPSHRPLHQQSESSKK